MNKERMAAVRISTDFNSLLEKTNFGEEGKKGIEYIMDFFRKGHPEDFMYKTVLFKGEFDTGKSFFATALADHLSIETVYNGRCNPCVKDLILCKTLDEIIAAVSNDRKQLIILDNTNTLFRIVETENPYPPYVHHEDIEKYWSILDILDRSKNKLMISIPYEYPVPTFRAISNNCKIQVNFQKPSVLMKRDVLKTFFGAHLSQDKIDFIADNSVGYGFRDLFGVVTEAYVKDHSFSMASIEGAMRSHLPFSSDVAKIYHNIPIRFSDIIGKHKAMRIIRKVADAYSGGKSIKFGISRGNLLLFHGMHGTGKSFVAKAIAGETGKFLISVRPDTLKDHPHRALESFIDILKNYENSIVFIDEAEKLLKAHDSIEGFLNDLIEGADTNSIRGMLILAVNNISVLDPALLDRFVKIEFEPPIFEERLQFCRMKNDALEEGIREIIDIDALAKHTDGKSYRDIDRVWNELMFHHMDTGEALDAQKVRGIISKMDEINSKKISMYG